MRHGIVVALFSLLLFQPLSGQDQNSPSFYSCNGNHAIDILQQVQNIRFDPFQNATFRRCLVKPDYTVNLPPYLDAYIFLNTGSVGARNLLAIIFETNNNGNAIADIAEMYTVSCETLNGTPNCAQTDKKVAVNTSFENSGYGSDSASWRLLENHTGNTEKALGDIILRATRLRIQN